METFEEIVKEYEAGQDQFTQKQKAELERRIWSLRPDKGGMARQWFSKRFGGPENYYEKRLRLAGAPQKLTEPLWNLIDKEGWSLALAVETLNTAEKRALTNGTIAVDELTKCIDEYNKNTTVKVVDGKVIRRRKVGPKTKSRKARSAPSVPSEVQEFKNKLRTFIFDYTDKALEETDSYEMKLIKRELFDWIEDGIDTFQRKLYRLKTNSKEERLYSRIGKTRFTQAIDVLGLKPTEFVFGKSIDLKKAKKAFLERARTLHPDSNQGSHAKQEEFQAVNDAYNLLKEYNDQLNGSI